MTTFFDPQPPVIAATRDGPGFPVRRLFCIGRNYASHAREMGSDPEREAPFFFTKWAEAVVPSGTTTPYPPETADFHYEAELVVAIGTGGRAIAAGDAAAHIWGYAAGLDMTRRDLQAAARDQGRPWDVAKNVEQSAPLGPIRRATGPTPRGRIRLTVNGETRQDADLSEMIWSVEEVIAYLSRFYRLEPGDLIFTGTPAGVGAVREGDELTVSIDGLDELTVRIGAPAA